jgi:hypothetical protein
MTAHRSMFERERTRLQGRLRDFGVTYEQIAELAGVSTAMVCRCLHRRAHLSVRFGTVFAVRAATAVLLARQDPEYDGGDLFDEYHEELRREVSQLDTTQPGRHDAGPAAVH